MTYDGQEKYLHSIGRVGDLLERISRSFERLVEILEEE